MVYQAVNNRTGNKNWKIGHCNPKKKGEKQDLPEENNLFSPTFIYLIGYQAVKRVKKGFHHDMVKIKCFRQQLPTPKEHENFLMLSKSDNPSINPL